MLATADRDRHQPVQPVNILSPVAGGCTGNPRQGPDAESRFSCVVLRLLWYFKYFKGIYTWKIILNRFLKTFTVLL